jgi:7-carboxy-7-deazaguanine synthase
MLTYPVTEVFVSIQGEGAWAGTPMQFIRLAGCNLNCTFCDQPLDKSKTVMMNCDDLLTSLLEHQGIKRVCITGGEPLIHDIDPLISTLHSRNFNIHLETNGTKDLPQGHVDWITVSPKTVGVPWNWRFSEWKFLCGQPGWEGIIEPHERQPTLKYVQPVWGPDIKKNTQLALGYVFTHSSFRMGVQLHKILEVQ